MSAPLPTSKTCNDKPSMQWLTPWRILAAVTAGLLLALLLSPWDGPLPTHKTGTIGDWAGGVGALAAVAASLWFVADERRHSAETLRNDRAHVAAQQRRALQWERQTFVRSVLAKQDKFNNFGTDAYALHLTVHNFSPFPIRVVRVVATFQDGVDVYRDAAKTPLDSQYFADFIGPNGSIASSQAPTISYYSKTRLTDPHVLQSFGLLFIDIWGDEWLCTFGQGNLIEIRLLHGRSEAFRDPATLSRVPYEASPTAGALSATTCRGVAPPSEG